MKVGEGGGCSQRKAGRTNAALSLLTKAIRPNKQEIADQSEERVKQADERKEQSGFRSRMDG